MFSELSIQFFFSKRSDSLLIDLSGWKPFCKPARRPYFSSIFPGKVGI